MRRFLSIASLLLGVLVTGCYTLQPAAGIAPEIGDELAFDINDVGRVALGGSMGPEIAQIDGRLVSRENAEYLVAVTGLHFLRGGEQVWTGEQVHVKSEYVNSIYERRYSKGRTYMLGVVGIAAFAFIVTRALNGSGSDAEPVTPPPTGSSIRVP